MGYLAVCGDCSESQVRSGVAVRDTDKFPTTHRTPRPHTWSEVSTVLRVPQAMLWTKVVRASFAQNSERARLML